MNRSLLGEAAGLAELLKGERLIPPRDGEFNERTAAMAWGLLGWLGDPPKATVAAAAAEQDDDAAAAEGDGNAAEPGFMCKRSPGGGGGGGGSRFGCAGEAATEETEMERAAADCSPTTPPGLRRARDLNGDAIRGAGKTAGAPSGDAGLSGMG